MKFSYNWLRQLAGFKESPEKLAEFLTLRALEVESVIGGHKKEHARDWALDIKLLPNRVADASGHVGIAREIATLKNSRITYHGTQPKEAEPKASQVLRVKIENPDDCPRYTARVMTGVSVKPSPRWMRERLEVCGIQSISNIVDAANYVMLELGQPLHVFDYDTLEAEGRKTKAIVVRRARKNEELLALDAKTYPLSPEILVIADATAPVAIAGIKGGKHSGVSARTRTIVLESANFDPIRIRIAAQRFGLKTDASYRFERGMDPNETAPAVDRLAELIQELAGGETLAGRVDSYPRPLRPARILFRADYARRLMGTDIPATFFAASFRRIGWDFTKQGRDYVVSPPTVRRDIQIEEDIVEEMVRRWGYERIASRPPATTLAPAAPNEERSWEEKVRDILAASGMTEALVYLFTGERALAVFGETPERLLELENPTSPETRYLAAHPAEHYLRIAAENLRHEERIRLFGIMKGMRPPARSSERIPAEERKYLVIAAATQNAKRSKDSSETFYEIKGTLDQLFESLGIADHWYDDVLTKAERQKAKALHPYRTAKIMVGDTFLGLVAELHPTIAERLKVKGRMVFSEINFEKLWKLARAEAEFRPIGKYPAAIRDIALVVPEDTKTEAVLNVIETAGGKLLTDTDLFDYFQDEAMEERGEKSLAFHLIFQSPERTLTDEEVNRVFKKIVSALKTKDWEIRG